jgi:hypothetical protein
VSRLGVGRRRIAVGVSAVALAVGLASCTSARSTLGTSDGSCFRAIPAAVEAVHSHGRLLGGRLFTSSALHHKAPRLYSDLSSHHTLPTSVCVMAFKGTFTKGAVSKPLGRSSGALAVVVTSSSGHTLVGTVIFRSVPLALGHSHVG